MEARRTDALPGPRGVEAVTPRALARLHTEDIVNIIDIVDIGERYIHLQTLVRVAAASVSSILVAWVAAAVVALPSAVIISR